ncbi:MAG: sensor histidine kinase [Synechococcaceae cyanobacterium RM1_1_27]|nr:sensor histidine kinase [Synechococcaceae cyanobacterium RM1_1_27]
MINLLSNAMKYSQPHQIVELRLKAHTDQILLEVMDQGIGIPEQDHPYLFDPFHRGRNVGTIPGTGLGLTIIKRLIDLLAGSIEVESQLGVGTTFRVRLPLASAA